MTINREIDVRGQDGGDQPTDRVSGQIHVQVADTEKARLIAMAFQHAELLAFRILGNKALE